MSNDAGVQLPRTNVARRVLRSLLAMRGASGAVNAATAWASLGGSLPQADSDRVRLERAARAILVFSEDVRRLRTILDETPGLDADTRDNPLAALDNLITTSIPNLSNNWAGIGGLLTDGVIMAVRFWATKIPDDELDVPESRLGPIAAEIEETLRSVLDSSDFDEQIKGRLHTVLVGLRDVLLAARVGGSGALRAALVIWENLVRATYEHRNPQEAEASIVRKFWSAFRTVVDDAERIRLTVAVSGGAATNLLQYLSG